MVDLIDALAALRAQLAELTDPHEWRSYYDGYWDAVEFLEEWIEQREKTSVD